MKKIISQKGPVVCELIVDENQDLYLNKVTKKIKMVLFPATFVGNVSIFRLFHKYKQLMFKINFLLLNHLFYLS